MRLRRRLGRSNDVPASFSAPTSDWRVGSDLRGADFTAGAGTANDSDRLAAHGRLANLEGSECEGDVQADGKVVKSLRIRTSSLWPSGRGALQAAMNKVLLGILQVGRRRKIGQLDFVFSGL